MSQPLDDEELGDAEDPLRLWRNPLGEEQARRAGEHTGHLRRAAQPGPRRAAVRDGPGRRGPGDGWGGAGSKRGCPRGRNPRDSNGAQRRQAAGLAIKSKMSRVASLYLEMEKRLTSCKSKPKNRLSGS